MDNENKITIPSPTGIDPTNQESLDDIQNISKKKLDSVREANDSLDYLKETLKLLEIEVGKNNEKVHDVKTIMKRLFPKL
jgi:hypothetical protein